MPETRHNYFNVPVFARQVPRRVAVFIKAADVNPIAAVVKQVAQYLDAPVSARDVGELLPAEVASKSISFCTVRNLQTP